MKKGSYNHLGVKEASEYLGITQREMCDLWVAGKVEFFDLVDGPGKRRFSYQIALDDYRESKK